MTYMKSAAPAATNADRSARLFAPGYVGVCVLVTSLFFLWGIPNNLNDILIRQFMKSFPITRLQAGLVQSAFYMGYFLLAVPSALYMRRLGYKAGFITGLLLFGGGTFLFWPAAIVGRYSFFLLALFVMASGLAFLETASNTFIALSGPAESSERRLNLSQAFNPLGSIAGALIGTRFILSGGELSAVDVHRACRVGRGVRGYPQRRLSHPVGRLDRRLGQTVGRECLSEFLDGRHRHRLGAVEQADDVAQVNGLAGGR